MKYILSIILLSMLGITGVNASELTGRISTDPNELANILNNTSSGQSSSNQNNTTNAANASTDTFLSKQNQEIVATTTKKTKQMVIKIKTTKKIKVLGISLFPDGSLLRDSYHRIYLIKSGFKKRIFNLQELQKYKGQTIYDVSNEDLSLYQSRGYLDGELIREKGKPQVYVIVNGQRQRILNLAELHQNYRGLEILTINPEK
ncbi:MAG: hypothetical protein NTW06_04340 [Candidatus Falkowbacteria bacterium]|nr:hypothetical protein [Candidatus Falkowbacteria bacterium]